MAEINTVTENNETRAPLTVVATITAGEGQAEAVEAALRTAHGGGIGHRRAGM
ncbi:hypothetical protein M988_3783 [Hafnia paralvei ATCC 29927]|nr:hypothetical protein M988_3783 [Hafnia paralvei ATCC 29927]